MFLLFRCIKIATNSALAAELGDRVRFRRTDVAEREEVGALVAQAVAEFGALHAMINNAAIYPSRSIEDYSMEELDVVQRVNVQAAIVCVRAVLPAMKQ